MNVSSFSQTWEKVQKKFTTQKDFFEYMRKSCVTSLKFCVKIM